MSSLFDLGSLIRVAGISLLASVGVVLLFSVAVATTDVGAGDRPGGDPSTATRLLGRATAAVALALCVAALVSGLLVMLRS
jgi:hypothetical protein